MRDESGRRGRERWARLSSLPTWAVSAMRAVSSIAPGLAACRAALTVPGVQQLVLMSHPSWQQPLAPEVEARRLPRLTVWTQIHGYLTPVSQVDAVREWARGKNWHGRWMPRGSRAV